MGHIHLSVLPKSRSWAEVVELLRDDAPAAEVITGSIRAAEKDLLRAAHDPGFVETVRLLGLVPLAGRSPALGRALGEIGLASGANPDLFALVAAIGARLDLAARSHSRSSDFSELSRRALMSVFAATVGGELEGFFKATPADLKRTLETFSSPRNFALLARQYFTRLLSDTLRYWLDRELAAHVGPGERFEDLSERSAFDRALVQFSAEATRIVREFAAGWYAKRISADGTVTTEAAAAFGAVAFKKICEELRRKRGRDD